MSIREDLNSSKDAPSQADGIAFCDVFYVNISCSCRRKPTRNFSFCEERQYLQETFVSWPFDMAFTDLLLGAVGLPICIGNRMNASAFRDLWARVMF